MTADSEALAALRLLNRLDPIALSAQKMMALQASRFICDLRRVMRRPLGCEGRPNRRQVAGLRSAQRRLLPFRFQGNALLELVFCLAPID